MRIQLRSLVSTLTLVLASFSSTQAADITFNLSGLPNQSSVSLTSGAYTLNMFNPVNSGGTSGSFYFDSDGVYLGSHSAPFNTGFDMSVTGGSLQFKSYVISWNNGSETGSFSLLGGTGTSTGNLLAPKGNYTFAGTKIMSPGDTVTLSGTITSGSLCEIKSITFSTVSVPEPSTYALAATATGVMTAMARRRKARKA